MKQSAFFMITVLFSSIGMAQNSVLPGVFDPAEALKITCDGERPINSHMRTMARLISDMNSFIDDILKSPGGDVNVALMERSQRLRVHLSAVMHKLPPKIYKIDPSSVQKSQLVFQEYLLRVMFKTVEIESELLKQPTEPWAQQAQRVKLANLIFELEGIVTAAHHRFRE